MSVAAWLPGPLASISPSFRVMCIEAGPRADHPVYVSVGASLLSRVPLEFVVAAPRCDPGYVELLAMVALYHHRRDLDFGHTLPIGHMPLSIAAPGHFLVSLPYPFGPDLEVCETQGGTTHLAWLLPVWRSEVLYRHANGTEALERLLDARGVDYLDGQRQAVV